MNCVLLRLGVRLGTGKHYLARSWKLIAIYLRGSGLQAVHMPRFGLVGRVPSWSLSCTNIEESPLGI